MVKVSVIIPVYNSENLLETCVQNVLEQTFGDFELILVNDGSTDGSGRVCDLLAKRDKRMKVIHKKNGGASSARNAGLDVAQGEFICFVDSDDIVSKKLLETALRYQSESGSDIVEFGIKYIDDVQEYVFDSVDFKMQIFNGKDMIKKIYQDTFGGTIYLWDKLYKKDLFDTLRFEEGRICEDTIIMPLLYDRANTVCVINTQLYLYYQSSGSVMRSEFSLKRVDAVYALEKNREYYLEKNYSQELQWLDNTYAFVLLKIARSVKEHFGKENEAYQMLKKRFKSRFKSYLKNKTFSSKQKILLFYNYITI